MPQGAVRSIPWSHRLIVVGQREFHGVDRGGFAAPDSLLGTLGIRAGGSPIGTMDYPANTFPERVLFEVAGLLLESPSLRHLP